MIQVLISESSFIILNKNLKLKIIIQGNQSPFHKMFLFKFTHFLIRFSSTIGIVFIFYFFYYLFNISKTHQKPPTHPLWFLTPMVNFFFFFLFFLHPINQFVTVFTSFLFLAIFCSFIDFRCNDQITKISLYDPNAGFFLIL